MSVSHLFLVFPIVTMHCFLFQFFEARILVYRSIVQ
ncbi:hypothetical protein TcasGA2_TC034760 [Tribolium castaneum]|uniref:Uncharacterized protein n=1 Tax=Tribolium castaneum TaxID=7070 RepID=A0A139WFN9_TRICA|nr:hypothetical protein TcasGA2_TC034760 [Tribolium castaneum]